MELVDNDEVFTVLPLLQNRRTYALAYVSLADMNLGCSFLLDSRSCSTPPNQRIMG